MIDTIGLTRKSEGFENTKYPHKENTLVLENTSPYSGYGNTLDVPVGDNLVNVVYFTTLSLLPYSVIIDITKQIKKEFKTPFQATVGNIRINGIQYNCIKIYDFEDSSRLLELQMKYYERGIRYISSDEKINEDGVAVFYKQMLMEKMEGYIYSDTVYPDVYYVLASHTVLSVPNSGLNKFNKIIEISLKNLSDYNIVVTPAKIFMDNNIKLAIKVFSYNKKKKLGIVDLKIIREEFIKNFKKYY